MQKIQFDYFTGMEGANVYLQFKKINPLKNCTLTISYQQREDTRNFSATHFCGGNPVKT